MLEDQVAFLLQKYLGNYVRGLNKEALKISAWRGDVELTNMQLKPEALNALKLPVKVKAGFLGSVKLKVPWSRLGQEPVLVYLDRIFILVEPATQVEGCSEDIVQEAKKTRIREMEMKLLESRQQLKSEVNTSWLGSLISTIIGNLKLSITNIHIRYEDLESNPGHPFAAGVTLAKLSAVTVDDGGKETFITGGALEQIQKSVELERLALYFDSDIHPWNVDKPWEDLLPSEWSQVFEIVSQDGKPDIVLPKEHSYILQPVTGNAKYSKLRPDVSQSVGQPLQKAAVNLDDVTLCLSKDGYRDILKLADNFSAFNQRLKYAHYRPLVPVKSDPHLWWKYAYKAVSDQMKKASGKMSWEHVLRYARLRKRYISLYASLLKSDVTRLVVDDDKDIEELDRELDIELILHWRMLAHKFVEQSTEYDQNLKKQKTKRSWWSLGWTEQSSKDESEPARFSEEDWEQLNKIIGYREGADEHLVETQDRENMLHTLLEIRMKHNATKLINEGQESLAELSCEGLNCSVKLYSEAKVFDLKLGSYQLSSPNGILAESATFDDSLVGIFSYKPFDTEVDWSLVAKASPCYMTYLKESIDQIISFFKRSTAISQTIALETAAAMQMTIDEVKRTAQQQVTRALKDHDRFLLDLDIAAPKITIPTEFRPDNFNATKLLLNLGNFVLRTEDDHDSPEESELYLRFTLSLSDVSAFLVDGDYHWSRTPLDTPTCIKPNYINFLPVIDKCGIALKLQQIRSEYPLYPSTRLAVRLPSLGFHFSPMRYHRLLQVAKIFQNDDSETLDFPKPWNQADFEGWLFALAWKGVGNREAVWQRRYFCLVGPFLYILESPASKTYKQCLSLRGKQVYQVPPEHAGNVENVLAVCDAGQSNIKVIELVNALILRFDNDDSRRTWQNRLQGAIYRASASAALTSLSEISSDPGDTKVEPVDNSNTMDSVKMEKMFITGVLDELRISFSSNHRRSQSFRKMLLAKETPLLEFRAIGGQVELSIRGNDMFIGTVLKSLEIEDLYNCEGMPFPRYLARSLIESTAMTTSNIPSSLAEARRHTYSNRDLNQTDDDDNFFEAADDLVDVVDSPLLLSGSPSEYFSAESSLPSDKSSIKSPSFTRIAGLLPDAELQAGSKDFGMIDTLGSFVKAQIVIYDQDSPLYNDIDKKVAVTLATLSFFCYRPTILAILEFANAINIENDNSAASEDSKSSAATIEMDTSRSDAIGGPNSALVQEPVVKGLLGKGKSRVIFHLSLNMARALIALMNENGTRLATLSQNNLLTDIKVFPSSFSIKAALGNLKISDDSLPSSHSYFWVCDMRNPGGSSFVEQSIWKKISTSIHLQGKKFMVVTTTMQPGVEYWEHAGTSGRAHCGKGQDLLDASTSRGDPEIFIPLDSTVQMGKLLKNDMTVLNRMDCNDMVTTSLREKIAAKARFLAGVNTALPESFTSSKLTRKSIDAQKTLHMDALSVGSRVLLEDDNKVINSPKQLEQYKGDEKFIIKKHNSKCNHNHNTPTKEKRVDSTSKDPMLDFSSFSIDDEDYRGYDYSLFGQLSEVRIVYLNRFVQEVASYFMGLVPSNSKSVVKLKDQVTNSEKWFTTSEIEGSPALKLDLSLKKPIIVMPRRTDSLDYLELDVLHITVQNTFQWLCGDKNEMGAVHLEILTLQVKDIHLTVGTGMKFGESIIQDVKGLSVVIRRSLRDLLHQIPTTEVAIKIEELKAALSNREYQIITECALSNISETPHSVPPLHQGLEASSDDVIEHLDHPPTDVVECESQDKEEWITMKVSVAISLVELSLHSGVTRDAALATLQVTGAWLLYKSNSAGDGFLLATLKGFTVIDDREGTEQEFRLAIGKPESFGYSLHHVVDDNNKNVGSHETNRGKNNASTASLTMLILDAKFSQSSTAISLCVQRPQMLVALDFLLAIVEFFVPTVRSMLSNEEDNNSSHIVAAIILDQPIYYQPSAEFSLSPQKPLFVDDERFDHFVYDGKGGSLYLQDRQGRNLSSPSPEPIIYVGSGKWLQFKNVFIKNGEYLDSCILLGSNSSYSASENDNVFLERGNKGLLQDALEERREHLPAPNAEVDRSTEFIIELQAIGPELIFYSTSKDVGESMILSTKLLHAQLDAFCRLVLKGDTVEMSANALGLTVESNGVNILEPFDTCMKFSNASGKTNIHFAVSDVFMNFSFSILRLFLAIEEDILTFLRMTSRKVVVVCYQFDNVGRIQNHQSGQTYSFWRPRAPPGFVVLGDCLTPLNEAPTKGVVAINTSFARVKRPVSFKLIWPSSVSDDVCVPHGANTSTHGLVMMERSGNDGEKDDGCSIWFPVAPQGYVALGCVVSEGRAQPPLSSALCILASLVSPCALKDCITLSFPELYSSRVAFWRVDNSLGSFLPADPISMSLIGKAYELRHMIFGYSEGSSKATKSSNVQEIPMDHDHALQSETSAAVTSGRLFQAVASFRLVWWNQGASSRKKLSIWRPVVPTGMVYLGDIAVQGYEPPNASVVLHDSGDEAFLKAPQDFHLVGRIKKHKGVESISFWFPQAPPGFVALGCIACRGSPKHADFSALRCIRFDMVTGDQFPEESIWDTSDVRFTSEPFSIWPVGNEVGTFIVRSGFRRPPKRFALKLADPNASSSSDNMVIDAEIRTFSAALFDDYGGLMVPLFNISLTGIGFGLRGRPDYLNSTVSFSSTARSFNDKYDSWEPLVEPMDGFLRYQYDLSALGAASQLRVTSTRDLNLNISVSNANMILQAYTSWNNLSHSHESYKKREAVSPTYDGGSIIDIHHGKNYYIIPKNMLGRDIFIRATENRGTSNIIRMPSGDSKHVKVPVSKNMLDSHLKGNLRRISWMMVTIIISDAELPDVNGLTTHQYATSIRVFPNRFISNETLLQQQNARTCGVTSEHSTSSGLALVNWSEIFFFKVDSLDYYMMEITVTDVGKGEPIGFCSAPLKEIASELHPSLNSFDSGHHLRWIELSSAKSTITQGAKDINFHGRLRCAVLYSPRPEVENDKCHFTDGSKSGFIQISPSREGPWTTVRLNYAAPAACWRLGNDVVASVVSVKDGMRYVNIRSLVSVCNNTDFIIDVCINAKASFEKPRSEDDGNIQLEDNEIDIDRFETDEFFETEKYNPSIGWVSCFPHTASSDQSSSNQGLANFELPSGWEVIDDWHVDNTSVKTADGWVYAPDQERLKWPNSFNHINYVNYARQRRWIRNRKCISSDGKQQISVGPLKPGETLPLPLSVLTHPRLSYFLQIRPKNVSEPNEYSWSLALDRHAQSEVSGKSEEISKIYLSSLVESEKLLYCPQNDQKSSKNSQGLWFCLSIQATEIGKDIHSDPIQDWNLVITSPLSIINFLPLSAEFSVLEKQSSGQFIPCSRGIFRPSETVKVYNADMRNPLYFSLLPQGGWQPVHEAVLISHPTSMPFKTIALSSLSGRIVHVILEQNNKEHLAAKVVRVYAPYWIASARCPPLTYRLLDISGRKGRWHFSLPHHPNQSNEKIFRQITEDEVLEGYTIDSALDLRQLGLSVSISRPGKERFGPVRDLSPLGGMDGSIDLYAYDADGNCIRLFVSSKPSPYQSVPTKVILVRPFMTFTNRLGEDMFVKLSSGDQPKVLHASDSRASFVYSEAGGPEKLQVRLEDTEWCFPVEIVKEDTISVVLRKHNGGRRFLRTEIRGYEEGSRFLIVFRLGSANGPIRIENRTNSVTINLRQSGLTDDAWVQLQPLSTTNFSWEDPYGQKLLDVSIHNGSNISLKKFTLENTNECFTDEWAKGIRLLVLEMGDIKIARFMDDPRALELSSHAKSELITSIGNWDTPCMQSKMQNNAAPMELIIELGVVGISVIDHRPRELLYLYLERVFISYSTGYDGGMTSRFKLILGLLQLDNQLPLTSMPVLLAPEHVIDTHHPVFKMTITMSNENTDGTQVYPYVYIRVTEKCWRLSIHEPIIWALVDFYNNLRMDRIPKNSSVTQVDPEIRIDLIDVSEVKLKLSLETAPSQRPDGVLGMWSPILSAVGNAFKIQVHLRKVMHRNRFMRKSSVVSAIVNRIWRDLIHNPLHLVFAVDVLGLTSSTLASLSKGFAELSTDEQFLHLRSKQVWSRRITGVSDGILQGTEALAQGVAFGLSGVVTKPVESARQDGLLGFAQGIGRAFLGFIVQPVSGALDFFSLTVDGIGASCSRCLEVFSNKVTYQRIRNPRAIHANGILKEYSEREALGQMILYLAEASRHFGCTEIFKEPSKYAWSDYYEEHFIVPYQRIVVITNKRVMLLQCPAPDKLDKKPCKITWDVPWEELMALELAKAGHTKPSHLILHLKNFKRSEPFVRLIKCSIEEEQGEALASRICCVVRKMWKAHQLDMKSLTLKVPSSQRHVHFAWDESSGKDPCYSKPMIKPREFSSFSSSSDEKRFVKHSINFQKIWSSEQDNKSRCILCPKQAMEEGGICSIWRPICPDGYVSVGDIARVGIHPPNVAAVYQNVNGLFAMPLGYDLIWRNCAEDYVAPVSIWYPRPPEGFISIGCVGVPSFAEPLPDSAHCVSTRLAEETMFEETVAWTAPDSYPWACYFYQVQSEALHFVALRQPKDESDWKPMRVFNHQSPRVSGG